MGEYRRIEGKIKFLRKKNEHLLEVDIYSLNPTNTLNKWRFTDMEGNKAQFAGKPVLTAYQYGQVGAGHNSTKRRDKDGKEYLSYMGATDQRIIGAYSDNPDEMRVEEIDGIPWIVGRAFIWRWYAREAAEKIEEYTAEGKPMSVSIEALVEEYHMDGDIEVEDVYTVLGVSVLGDGVNPAVPGAHIAALSEIDSDFKELKLRAASYMEPEGEKKEEPEPANNNKPQKKSEKEIKALKAFSKKQLAAIAPKFDGFTVLAAGQDETGIHVCLMSDDGATAVYTMETLEDTFAPEKVIRTNSQVVFEFGEEVITVDCCDITDEFGARVLKANSKAEKLESDLKTANETISAMQESERKRRLSAAKAKAQAVLANFNANSAEQIDDACLNSINEKIDAGEYSECVDKEGCWVGEEMVERDVLAECAKKQMEINAKACAAKSTQYGWDNYGVQHENGATDVESFLASYGKK